MPEPRPVQTYSTLLEDRRIIDAAAEANEPPSLVVHLLEKEWTISTGKAAHPGPSSRRFSYSQPISSLLDDIQARRIPSEFTDIFRKLDVKFFEGCLLVELHDSRPPVKGSKPTEPSIAKYVLRPTAESLWSDIRTAVSTKQTWGDKEALELEARLVLSTAPPLCLDPSPTVNRIANVVVRSSAYGKTSFKRKQNDETDDDGEIIKRRKLMQLMNPRVGKSFTPSYRTLRHIDQKQNPQAVVAPGPSAIAPAPAPAPAPPAQNIPRVPNPTAPTAAAPHSNLTQQQQQMAQVAMKSQQQATLLGRQRAAGLQVPPDAQMAAVLAARSRSMQQAQNQGQAQNASQQQVAQAQALAQAQAMRAAAANAQVAAAAAGTSQQPNAGQSQAQAQAQANLAALKKDPEAMAQFAALQNGKQPFALTMPAGVKRPPTAMGGASPPKPNVAPNGVGGVGANAPTNGMQAQPMAQDAAIQQTPRMQNAVQPNPAAPVNPAAQPGMQATGQQPMQGQNPLASYHQNIVSGQQNQMQQMHTTQQAYAAGGMRPGTYPAAGYANPYAYVAAMNAQARQPQMNGAPVQNNLHAAQMAAYRAAQQGMGMPGQPMQQMHPGMTMQMQMGQQYAMQGQPQNQAQVQQAQQTLQIRNQRFMQEIKARADQAAASMAPENLQGFIDKAPEQLKNSPAWANAEPMEKAKLVLFHIFRLQQLQQLSQHAAAQQQQQQLQQQGGNVQG